MAFMWVVSALLFMFWDVWYFVQCILITAASFIQRKLHNYDLMDESVYRGICLTTDLDFQFHMNNARYMRECDFGRITLWMQNGVYDTVTKLNGALTLGGSTIRYRKSLQLFDRYNIKTRILCWDEKAFYLEQRFVRPDDGFVMAIALLKQTLLHVTPRQVVAALAGEERHSPAIPADVEAWIQYNALSSDKLKQE